VPILNGHDVKQNFVKAALLRVYLSFNYKKNASIFINVEAMYWQLKKASLLWATSCSEINEYKIELERNFKNLDVERE